MATDVGQRYARALLEVTEDRKETEKASAALQSIAGMLKRSHALQALLVDPRMKPDRYGVFEALAHKIDAPKSVVSLIRTLDSNERLVDLQTVADAFVTLADTHLGRVRGLVRSAAELSDAQKQTMQASVSDVVGKTVTLEFVVDASLVGGVVVKVQDLVWDGSVKTQLQSMRQALRS